MATGFLLFALGLWIVFRSVRGNPSLPDLILGKGSSSSSSPAGG